MCIGRMLPIPNASDEYTVYQKLLVCKVVHLGNNKSQTNVVDYFVVSH